MASPMRKSTFPLVGSCFGSMCKLDFEYVVVMLLLVVYTPWFSLAHPCGSIEERWTFENVYVIFWIGEFMLKL